MIKEYVTNAFRARFGEGGTLYASAGRINLIGEHTDYNEGYVFPGAVDCGIVAMLRPNGTQVFRVCALDLDAATEFGMREEDRPIEGWAGYVFGVCREILKRGCTIGGFDAVFAGDVPLGAGMSSSAAIESAFAFALNDLYSLGIDPFGLARIGQATEHNYCGVNCGIMDQFASVFGRRGNLIRLDCRSMAYRYFPFDPQRHGYRLVLLDTAVKHELADSPYNRRRESCERVARAMGACYPDVRSLRDADMPMLEAVKGALSDEDYRRARYIIGENQRVLCVCEALERDDYETVGRMMYQTHEGLKNDYEVSCGELDFLNELARWVGVTGSRMMGGGFGGCTINLLREAIFEDFVAEARRAYAARFGHELRIYPVVISDGARKLATNDRE